MVDSTTSQLEKPGVSDCSYNSPRPQFHLQGYALSSLRVSLPPGSRWAKQMRRPAVPRGFNLTEGSGADTELPEAGHS